MKKGNLCMKFRCTEFIHFSLKKNYSEEWKKNNGIVLINNRRPSYAKALYKHNDNARLNHACFCSMTDSWISNMTMYIYDDFQYRPEYSDINSTEFKSFESSFCNDVSIPIVVGCFLFGNVWLLKS